jgi:CubicO group peptidase (beta-lactamase class C family)
VEKLASFAAWVLALGLLAGCARDAEPAVFPSQPYFAPPPPPAVVEALARRVRVGDRWVGIDEAMRSTRTPGVSAAVVLGGRLVWARGFGLADASAGTPMTSETVLQAASISKAVSAVGIMKLVEQDEFTLDDDVTDDLDWKARLRGRDVPVTLRQLLSHSAGTTVSGFDGYPRSAPIPPTEQLLFGKGNSPLVRLERAPRTATKYSGGGFLLAQAFVEIDQDEPFAEVMHRALLEPFGMRRSTFRQPLSPARERWAAAGHDASGRTLVGRSRIYPEGAAAGLWTTPTDLAILVMHLQRALRGEPAPISRSAALALVTPTSVDGRVGLGWFLEPLPGGVRARHNGRNAGFTSTMQWSTFGDAIIVMTNGEASLGDAVLAAIAQAHGIP